MKDKMKVLFATDFSETSKTALRFIATLQKKYSTDVHLIHVITSFWKDWIMSGLHEKQVAQRLESWQHEITDQSADGKKLHIEKGNAADAIIHTAAKIKADLILLGSEKNNVCYGYIKGTTAEAVIRSTQTKVWLCKGEQVKQIICGIDCSPSCSKALTEAIDIAQRFSAKLNIVCAIPNPDFNPLGMEAEEIKKEEERFKTQQIKEVETFLKDFDLSKIDVQISYPWGKPAKVLLNMAADFDYDLIVIGAKGCSALSHVLMGSTAERVLHNTPCSLLVVH